MNDKGEVVAEFNNEKWLWGLTVLYDISHHITDLKTKLQGQ
jgi:hypothetical protein